MSYDIIEKLKKEIEGFKDEAGFENVGIVTETSDGIARVSGLSGALSQEILNIETEAGDIPTLASNLEESSIGTIILGDFEKVKIGHRVRQTGKVLSIKVSPEIIGRVVDPLGRPLDNKGVIFSAEGGSSSGGKLLGEFNRQLRLP